MIFPTSEAEDLRERNRRLTRDLEASRAALSAERAEVARLKAGQFTADEVHDICHELHNTVDAQGFADGCALEQRRLYGCAPDRDALSQAQAELVELRERRAI